MLIFCSINGNEIWQHCTKIKILVGDAGHRSPYLSHAKRALYHLSYIPFCIWEILSIIFDFQFKLNSLLCTTIESEKVVKLSRLTVIRDLHNKVPFKEPKINRP